LQRSKKFDKQMRDISFGQYYPAESPIHKIDARIKMLLLILLVVFIFFIRSFVVYAAYALFILFTTLLSKVPLRSLLKSVRGVLMLMIFIFLMQLFMHQHERILASWWVFTISVESIIFAFRITFRLVLLVMTTALLSLTTSPTQLTDGLESLMSPLRIIKFPVSDTALIMGMALRFIPNLIEETDKIIMAQKARGSGFDTGGFIQKAKSMLPILIPLFISAFRRAAELADALDARCYGINKRRTKMRKAYFAPRDFVAVLLVAILITFIMLERYYIGGLDYILWGIIRTWI
jgi:energy-coupling factor transport system permease protein